MNIVAIGGGEKTRAAQHAIDLSGAEKPVVLLVPSAASTEKAYITKVSRLSDFFTKLGVEAAVLHKFNQHPSVIEVAHQIGRASLIYTIGGNSPYMLETMRDHGTDTAIAHAIRSGTVHAGTSAGALLPFELAHSNVARRPSEESWDYKYLPTLGLVPGAATAHADQHDLTPHGQRPESRFDAFLRTLPSNINVGYGIDNNAAVVFDHSGPVRVIREHPSANVNLVTRGPGGLQATILE